MLKIKMIPMQVYLPPELVQTYKTYAQTLGESFAEVVRQTLEENTANIEKMLSAAKAKQKQNNLELLRRLEVMHKKYKDVKDQYPDKTIDEILYGGKL